MTILLTDEVSNKENKYTLTVQLTFVEKPPPPVVEEQGPLDKYM